MKDCFLPPPFGDSRASIVLEGRHFRDEHIAVQFLTDRGFTWQEAVNYINLLRIDYNKKELR